MPLSIAPRDVKRIRRSESISFLNMMSDFDYALDVDPQQGFKEDWDKSRPAPGPMYNRRFNNGFMNAQYNEAFGDYRGGYGPSGGFRPRTRPYPSGQMRGRGFGPIGQPLLRPRGPPVHPSVKILTDCQVAPWYIQGMSWEILDMIEPGYCGLCSQVLESYNFAKMHYNSKNHYKAQKKFKALTYKTDPNIKESMKARNLYCELCDVQITSQAHADSHYSGRSHRAIVDERKPPKNAVLLLPGKEKRIEQLIRREKKHLKDLPPATAKDETKVPEVPDKMKNAPPELICEICKTTVTCTEQMTNHLNGKRHLSKEKQHILKMMKGEPDQAETETSGTGADAGAEVQEVTEMEQSETVADTEDDWTSGTGADWDSQHTAPAADTVAVVEID